MADKLGIGTFIDDEFELGSHGVDLFAKPNLDASLIYGKTVTYYPASAIVDGNPIEFILPQEGNDYTFLPLTRLEGEISVTKKDGTALSATEKNSIVNLFPSTLFRQVECEINGTQICDLSTPTYPYKSFIETHYSFGEDAKKTHLRCEYYEKETNGKEETFEITGAAGTLNTRFVNGHTLCTNGEFSFSSLLHIDFFHSQKYLIPGTDLKLKFIRHEDSFSLLGATLQAKIKLHSLRLNMRKLTLDPQIVQAHKAALVKQPVIYNITQSQIKTHLLTKGIKNERITNIFRGKLPRSLMVFFVESEAFDGSINKNPFLFKHFDLNYFQLYINGEPFMTKVFQPDFSKNKFIREYRWALDNIGIQHGDSTNGITPEDYKSNSFVMAFDMSPDMCNGFHPHGSQQGTIDVQVAFKNVLPENIIVLFYAVKNEAIVIDEHGNVTLTSN
jgi:transposase-like protein